MFPSTGIPDACLQLPSKIKALKLAESRFPSRLPYPTSLSAIVYLFPIFLFFATELGYADVSQSDSSPLISDDVS
jgi:hypothetical protein